MKINDKGIALLKGFEGLRLKVYLCSAGIATVGYGATTYSNGMKVQMTDPPITVAAAEELLRYHLGKFEQGVEALLDVPVNENQFSALVSFAYNIGLGALGKSTLIQLVNKGDMAGTAEQFLVWCKANGQVIPGLLKRRKAERALFLTPVTTSKLPNGPSDGDIENKLKNIENKLLH